MHINTPHENDIHYNATEGCFEARITIRDATGIYVYAVQLTAPLMAELRLIKASLIETARQMHTTPIRGLHMHQLPPVPQTITERAA